MTKPKNICINLNRANQSSNGDNDRLLPNGSEYLNRLIRERINEIKTYTSQHPNEYNALKRHDSILIDGARGTGKTTVIERMKDDSELLDSAFVLDLIDPNQLDKSTNILDIIISNIFESLKNNLNYKKDDHSGDYTEVITLKQKIDKTIFDAEKKNYESISNKYTTTKSEMVLDQTIHTFALKVCKLLGKSALILPIDDIDMSVDHGNEIVETLRKYLQTPRIIPVIALDAAQIYALVKKRYFDQFNYQAKTPLKEITSESELSFLKKLPSEYIQKILPPSQRIVLPDMLGHYKNHLDEKKSDIFFEHTYDRNEDKDIPPTTLKLSFDELLKLIMSILFEYDGEKLLDPSANDYHIINYLKNKTFRSFVDDARAIFESLIFDKQNKENKDTYIVDRQIIKERFKMYSKNHSSNKHDSALWFWNCYIEKLKIKSDEKNKTEKKPHLNITEETLIIDTSDSLSLKRREKIYHRLYLQDFYVEEIKVTFYERTISNIEKTINIPGFLEFQLRTTFPAMLFEELCYNELVSLETFPIQRLKEFSKTDAYSSLSELYDNFVPFWANDYGVTASFLGFKIEKSSNSYRKSRLNFTTRYDNKMDEQEYFWHPFKLFVFFAEVSQELSSNKKISDKTIYSYMPKGYLNFDAGGMSSLKKDILKHKERAEYSITLNNSGIGIVSNLQNTSSSVKNIISILSNNSLSFEKHSSLITPFIDKKNIEDIDTFYQIHLTKVLANVEAILLNSCIINILDNNNLTYTNYNKNTKQETIISPIFKVSKDQMFASLTRYNTFLPFLVNDPFIRNLRLIFKIKEIKPFLNYLEFFMQLSNIHKAYMFDDKLGENIKKVFKITSYSTSENDFIRDYIDDILKYENKRCAYFNLIKKQLLLKKNMLVRNNLSKMMTVEKKLIKHKLELEEYITKDDYNDSESVSTPNKVTMINKNIINDLIIERIKTKNKFLNNRIINKPNTYIKTIENYLSPLNLYLKEEEKHTLEKFIDMNNQLLLCEYTLLKSIDNTLTKLDKPEDYLIKNIFILFKDGIKYHEKFITTFGIY